MIPPPRLEPRPDASALRENVFAFHGNSVRFLRPVQVTDEESGRICAVVEELEDRRVVAERWKHHPNPPPGSVQLVGSLRVRFAPAVPGHRYRIETQNGSELRLYEGPEVRSETQNGSELRLYEGPEVRSLDAP